MSNTASYFDPALREKALLEKIKKKHVRDIENCD
jgi:hypothetical protein